MDDNDDFFPNNTELDIRFPPPRSRASSCDVSVDSSIEDNPISPRSVSPSMKKNTSKNSVASGGDSIETNDTPGTSDNDDGQARSCLSFSIPINCCSSWLSKPSWTRVSFFVVRYAPCFCGLHPMDTSATDRAITFRLNILCAVMALGQVGAGVFCVVIFTWVEYEEKDAQDEKNERDSYLYPNLWNPIGNVFLLAFVGFILLITVLVTLRVIKQVNIIGAIRYYWVLVWILPIEIFLSISLFDYHKVTEVWVDHWWNTPAFAWLRSITCPNIEDIDFNTQCPNLAGTNSTRDDYCINCIDIREEAQVETLTVSYLFFILNGVWGLVLVVLVFLTLRSLEGIISLPIVQSSKERNIPAWLTLPIVGCAWTGIILLWAPSSVIIEFGSSVSFIGVTYMVSAGTFFFSAMLGLFISVAPVLNRSDKRRKEIAVILFLATMILTIFSVAAIFATSLVFSVNIVDVNFKPDQIGKIACSIDTAQSCTGCDDDSKDTCPEWTSDDVMKVLRTQLKQSATLGGIFLLYAFSALQFGFVLRTHVSMYQIDYV